VEELTRLQPDVDAVRRVGLWLASTSPIRGPVKIGWRCLARQVRRKCQSHCSPRWSRTRSIAHCSPRLATSSELIDGPAQDIDNYADGADAIEHFLALMRGPAPSHFLITVLKRRFATFVGADERWEVDPPGWNVSRREAFHAMCLEILGQSHRHQRVAALLTPDTTDSDFWNARVVARDLGMDTFEVTLRRTGQNSIAARGDRQRSRPRARSWSGVEGP